MHTFYPLSAIDRDTLMQQLLKRMTYLRRKLISDLEEGEKIFVHIDDRSLSSEDLGRLHQAMRAYGDTTLLYVRVTTTPARVGTVEFAGDGLFLGYIDRLGRGVDGEWNVSYDCWLTLCREVTRRIQQPSALGEERPQAAQMAVDTPAGTW